MSITLIEIEHSLQKEQLNLKRKRITDTDIQLICTFLNAHPEVTLLDLSWNKISSSGAALLAENTTLRTLNLERNEILADGAEAFAMNRTLNALILSWNPIGTHGATALAANLTLEVLHIKGCSVEVEGAKAFETNNSLKSLDISCNQIGDEGAKAITPNENLRWLDASDNEISDDGAGAFVGKKYNSLILSWNKIAGTIVLQLAENEGLELLDLGDNPIDDEVVKALARKRMLIRPGVYGEKLDMAAYECHAALECEENGHLEEPVPPANEPDEIEPIAEKNIPDASMGSISMMVLGGFIAAAGIGAVAVAFTLLHVATLGLGGLIAASIGAAAILSGVGLFAAATRSCMQTYRDTQEEIEHSSVVYE